MVALSSIVVDIDPAETGHPALESAVELARRCGARVKIVDVLPWVPAGIRHFVTPGLEQELVDHRRDRLEAIGAAVHGVAVTTELLRGRPGSALIQDVLQSGHDLLVRSHDRGRSDSPRPFGAIDMEILRQCPCPVWLVGRRGSLHGRWRILAAIHANLDDAAEQELNGTILDWALTLKAFGDAELTLLHAWTPYGASLLRSRMSSDEFADFLRTARESEDQALSGLLAPFRDRLTGVAVELVEGEPEDAIAGFVESHGIDVVVMGTVARTGIAGLVMGNTAERVLQRLRGSVLAVKPPGFDSPASRK